MQPENLITLGYSLEVDTDYVLRRFNDGELLLINLKPKDYLYENHEHPETIIALRGSFSIETADSSIQVNEGDTITVPPGVEHRFGINSDAIILAFFG